MERKTLRQRLNRVLLEWFLLYVLVSALVLGFSYLGLRQSVVEDRLLLARTIAHSLDVLVSDAVQDLDGLASQLPTVDADVAGRLRAHRFRSPFHEATYVLDPRGELLVSDPAGTTPIPRDALPSHEAATRLVRKEGRPPVLAIVHPFRREGIIYHLVAEMNPAGSALSAFLRDLTPEPGMHLAVVDARGAVIAAADSTELFFTLPFAVPGDASWHSDDPIVRQRTPCDFSHADRPPPVLAATVPLASAPWHVVVEQHESQAFAAAFATRRGLLIVGVLLAATGFWLSRTLSTSIVDPIRRLSERADRTRYGDLETAIEVTGDYEIELLAETLDEARSKLASTMRKLQSLNDELEAKVAARTEIIRAKYRDTTMLRDVAGIGAREREPERIAAESLRRVAEHWSFPAAAIVTHPVDGPAETYVFPPDAELSWLHDGEDPPDDWCRREIGHEGHSLAQLLHPRRADVDEEVMEATGQELATALHGAYHWKRSVEQDEQRKVLVRRLLDASEEERRRIARGLHDEISQLLTVIRLSLDRVEADTPEMTKAKNLLQRTQREIHRIIHDLRPTVLDNLGLATAMRSYAEEYLVRNGVRVHLEIEEELILSPEIETTTFRIYQEIVTNILRHSKAENVTVELWEAEKTLTLTVEDDGGGFDPEKRPDGSGLTGMRERASLVNATIRFDSEPGLGTMVRLEVPLR